MKTLRHLVKGKETEEKYEGRSRKISLPTQQYLPEVCESIREPRKGSLWQNVKRKLSLSISNEDSLKIEDQQTSTEKCPHSSTYDLKRNTTDTTEGRRLRRVSSDVATADLLLFAIMEGDISLLRRVVDDSQVNINYMRPPGSAPLHQACVLGNLEIVELLVKNGANIHMRDHKDLSPLQIANLNGHFEIAEFLIRMGSPIVDIKDGFQVDRRRGKRSSSFNIGPRQSAYERTKLENVKYD